MNPQNFSITKKQREDFRLMLSNIEKCLDIAVQKGNFNMTDTAQLHGNCQELKSLVEIIPETPKGEK